MRRSIVPDSFPQDQKFFLNDLQDEILGDILELDADVTTAGGELRPNEIGFNSANGKFFINIAGTTYLLATTTAV